MDVITSPLPMWISFIPLIVSLIIFKIGPKNEQLRNWLSIGCSVLVTIMSLLLFLQVRDAVVTYSLPWFLGFGLYFRVDFLGGLFALIVALVWLMATIFSVEYMSYESSRTRFYSFFIFTLGSCLGIFLTGDLFSLFLFFEMMTFAAYVLVIHEEDRTALRAGNVYLYMSIIGGLSLLAAVFFLQHVTGTTEFVPALDIFINKQVNPWVIVTPVIIGFGVKAGMIPVHIWLPKAHPVAPSPASALLSGLMIKAGAYGFIRVFFNIMIPVENDALWSYTQSFGYLFLWIGAITMFIGGIMALLNNSMKKVLAYSSISQMGYILFGLGIAIFLNVRGAFGLAGAWMHMINHAFYKSFLFLLAGAVFLQTHQLDLTKIGGFRKRMPFAFGFMLIAAASITGIPGFSGYVSKVLIHEAVLEAYHLQGWVSLLWLEKIFVLTSGLTVAYITKLWVGVFAGEINVEWSNIKDISLTHKLLFFAFSVILLGSGIFAQPIVNNLVIPMVTQYEFYAKDILHLTEVPFWHPKELAGPIIAYVIGILVLIFIGLKSLRRSKVPSWLSIEFLFYKPISRKLTALIYWIGNLHTPVFEFHKPKVKRDSLTKKFKLPKKYSSIFQVVKLPRKVRYKEDDVFWNTRNLTFDSLVLALVIALLLVIFLFSAI